MNQFRELFDAQKAYFATGITRSYDWRVEQLDRVGKMVADNEAALQAAMAADFKTAHQEQVFETLAEIREAEYQKSQLREWMAPVEAPLQPFLAQTGHRAMVYREPYGVALIVGPSNGPLLLLLRPAMCALAAGNTCIMKLSPAAAAVGALLLELIPKYFDPRAVTAVTGHRDVQTALLELPFDFIFCTGSTGLGKVVARAAAENLTPVLGVIDQAKVVHGGTGDPDARYLDPTIVYPVSWSDQVMKDEVFGPILPVLRYSSLDEAFDQMSQTPRPLAGYVFSRSQETIDRFVTQFSFGGGAVNQTNVALYVETMPFGGSGASGIGHYYGKYGFDMLSHAKSILVSPPDVAIEHLFPPFTPDKVKAVDDWFQYPA
jgi:acyl-CoA reductase-like NAD-dependent aldehyde dehydrogenase